MSLEDIPASAPSRPRQFVRAFTKLTSCFVAIGVPAGSNFLLTPILVRRFGPDNFATWTMIEPFLMIGASLLMLGANFGALNRVATGKMSAGAALAALLVVLAITAPILCAASVVPLIGLFGLATAVPILACTFCEALPLVVAALFRAEMKIEKLALFEGGRWSLLLAASLLCAAAGLAWIVDPAELLWTRAGITAALFVTLTLPLLKAEGVNVNQLRAMLTYGFPFVLAQLLHIVIFNSDRYIVSLAGLPKADLTIYIVHLKVAGILNLLVLGPLNVWFPTEAMRRNPSTEADFFIGTSALVIALLLLGILVVQVGVPAVWPTLFPGVPLNRSLLLAGNMTILLQGLIVILEVGLLRPGQTKWVVAPPLASSVVLATFSLAVTQVYGIAGLAWSRVVVFAVYALMVRLISQRIAPVRIPFVAFTPFGVAALALCTLPTAEARQPFDVVLAVGMVLGASGLGVAANIRVIRALGRNTGSGARSSWSLS